MLQRVERRGRTAPADETIKACPKCKLTWEFVNERVYQTKFKIYPFGVIPRYGKEIKVCPRCMNATT
jgi:Zn-finger nucleic acid-binding protein